jgi:branched-chain amino acid transport system permease protein
MVGGYIALVTITAGTNPMVAVFMAVIGCALLAVMIYRLAYVPQGPAAPRLSLLIAAIGVSMLLQNLAQLIFSANVHSFPANDIIPMVIYSVGGVNKVSHQS